MVNLYYEKMGVLAFKLQYNAYKFLRMMALIPGDRCLSYVSTSYQYTHATRCEPILMRKHGPVVQPLQHFSSSTGSSNKLQGRLYVINFICARVKI